MKRFLATLLFLTIFLCISASPVLALRIYLDVGGFGNDNDTPNSLTGAFDQFQFKAQTTTLQFDDDLTPGLSVGDTFSDTGDLEVIGYEGFIAPDGDNEGLGAAGSSFTTYALTASWTGLTGEVTVFDGTNQTTSYDSGGLINFYIDTVDQNWGSSIGSGDNTNFDEAGSTLIATISITGGTGDNLFDGFGTFITGSAVFNGIFTAMKDDFWYDASGNDLWDTYFNTGLGVTLFIDQNTEDLPAPVVTTPGGSLFQVDSQHIGTFSISVPEPGTLVLFGTGLIFLAGLAGRKRFFKKN